MKNKEIQNKVISHYRSKYARKTHLLNTSISIFLGGIIIFSSFYLINLQNNDSVEASKEISKVLQKFNENDNRTIYKEEIHITERYKDEDGNDKTYTKKYKYNDNLVDHSSEYSYSTIDGSFSFTTNNITVNDKTDQTVTFGEQGKLETKTYKDFGIKVDKRSEMMETIKLYKYLIDTNKVSNLKINDKTISFNVEYDSSKWTKDKVLPVRLTTSFEIDKDTYFPIKTITKEKESSNLEIETTYIISFEGFYLKKLNNISSNKYSLSGVVNIVWNTTKIADVYIGEQKIYGELVYDENSEIKDFWKILNGKEISVTGIRAEKTFKVDSIIY